jgi:AraC-like DNA-binding protein
MQVNMSTSTLHHHFRTLTAMSPLQYQKWLRLNEARRLMLTEQLDAATAAFQVGYESPSQFSREYSRMFGASPLRDIRSLHQMLPMEGSSFQPIHVAGPAKVSRGGTRGLRNPSLSDGAGAAA